MEKIIITKSEKETEQVGAQITAFLHNDSFLALFGELGAGKTALTRGLVTQLIPKAARLVHSPTFALVNEYIGENSTIYHFDMYRIFGADELYAIGFDDYLGNGIIITEWSENIVDALPADAIRVLIERISDNERRITISNLPDNKGGQS